MWAIHSSNFLKSNIGRKRSGEPCLDGHISFRNFLICNHREFWSGESITYGCIDPAEGVDASDSPTVTFECKSLSATANGTYQTPNTTKGENWPMCKSRTTTIKTRE